MGMKPRARRRPTSAFDAIQLGPHFVQVNISPSTPAALPVTEMRIEGGSLKTQKDGSKTLALRIRYDEGEGRD